jgi:hypothetical protein
MKYCTQLWNNDTLPAAVGKWGDAVLVKTPITIYMTIKRPVVLKRVLRKVTSVHLLSVDVGRIPTRRTSPDTSTTVVHTWLSARSTHRVITAVLRPRCVSCGAPGIPAGGSAGHLPVRCTGVGVDAGMPWGRAGTRPPVITTVFPRCGRKNGRDHEIRRARPGAPGKPGRSRVTRQPWPRGRGAPIAALPSTAPPSSADGTTVERDGTPKG